MRAQPKTQIFCRCTGSLSAALLLSMLGLTAMQACAISFSQLQTVSKLGEPLEAHVQIMLAPGEDATSQCLTTQPVTNSAGRFLDDLQLLLTGTGATRQLRLTTNSSINEPTVSFVLRSTCAGVTLSREYKLLLDPGAFQEALPIAQAKRLTQVLQRPQVVTRAGDTLRALSHRFGGNTKPKRKVFIAALREINPMLARYSTTDPLPKSLSVTLP